MHLLFLFYHQETSSPSQVDLFDSTPVAIIWIMVCPAFVFFNTISVFSFEKKTHYLIIGSSLLWKVNPQ